MKDKTYQDFRKIVSSKIPLIDVRAPIEYEKGSFNHSVNLPIMDNEDRHLIGTCYKEKGHDAAVTLGYQRVSGPIKESRVQAWLNFLEQYPDAMLYCFRGGSRSRITQEWIYEASGKEVLRLEGGYKAFRQFLLSALEPETIQCTPIILGGHTGCGKTILLHKFKNSLDLEGIANHRGSSFGQHITPQPTQINFENKLAYKLIQLQDQNHKHILVEDEGKHVGCNFIPPNLSAFFNQGELVVLEVPLEERVQNTLQEYVIDAQKEYTEAFGNIDGLNKWHDYILKSITKVKKRLGGDRFKEVCTLFEEAFKLQLHFGKPDPHESWITVFLRDYYDPMYAYQLQNTTKHILFRGNTSEVESFLSTLK